jgi:hypothetical protein
MPGSWATPEGREHSLSAAACASKQAPRQSKEAKVSGHRGSEAGPERLTPLR